jgi:hypothetical protein
VHHSHWIGLNGVWGTSRKHLDQWKLPLKSKGYGPYCELPGYLIDFSQCLLGVERMSFSLVNEHRRRDILQAWLFKTLTPADARPRHGRYIIDITQTNSSMDHALKGSGLACCRRCAVVSERMLHVAQNPIFLVSFPESIGL